VAEWFNGSMVAAFSAYSTLILPLPAVPPAKESFSFSLRPLHFYPWRLCANLLLPTYLSFSSYFQQTFPCSRAFFSSRCLPHFYAHRFIFNF
jgi:hypothetical protein